MTAYPAYPEYKETGIEWLGEIPSHWKAKRLRRVLTRSMKKNDDEIEREMLELSAYAGIRKKEYESDTLIRPKEDCLNYMVVKPQQLVVNPMWVINSGIGVSYVSGIVSPAYRVYDVTPDLVPNYLHYLVKSSIYLSQYKRFIRGLTTYDRSVREDDFLSIEALIPPLPEQRAIAAFLDERSARIDAAIAEYRRQADLLREKRAALISHAVTQGLDPAAPRKDSGIEWLGEIPAHWEVIRLKFIADVQTGVAKGRNLEGKEIIEVPYLRVANVQSGYVDLSDVATIEIKEDELGRYALQPNDILMTEGGDFDKLGRGTVWEGQITPCIHQNHIFAVRVHEEISAYWINLLTQADYARHYFILRSKQTTNLASISSTNIMQFPTIIPPLPEQRAIAAYLDEQTDRIDAALDEIDAAIAHLEEYRAALIAAAVTGKIDVRQATT